MSNTLTVAEGQPVTPLKWYEYRQNNSGGAFILEATSGIGQYVWVQARNAKDADSRAQEIGLYFYGCESGQDCDCCGDRWSPQYAYWKDDEGTTNEPVLTKWRMGDRWFIDENAFAHRYDGTFYAVTEVLELSE